MVTAQLAADGITVHTGAAVTAVRADTSGWCAVLGDGSDVGFDDVLVAVGRRPRTAGLGLADAGVDLDAKGFVQVDARLRTSNPRIFAAGDVTAYPPFTHTAGAHGSNAATNAILGLRRRVHTTIPRVTFTRPEIAAVGLSADGWPISTRSPPAPCHIPRWTERSPKPTPPASPGWCSTARAGWLAPRSSVPAPGSRCRRWCWRCVTACGHGISPGPFTPTATYGDGVWKAGIAQLRSQLARPATRRVIAALRRLRSH